MGAPLSCDQESEAGWRGDKRPCPLSQPASTHNKGTLKWRCSGALLGPFSLRDLNWVMIIKGLMFFV